MTFARWASLGVDLTLQDQLSPEIAGAKSTLQGMDDTVTKTQGSISRLGDELVSGGGKIREFRRLGSELGTVGRALGGDFENATNNISDFVTVAGSAGLATRGIVDLAPRAVTAIESIGNSSAITSLKVGGLSGALKGLGTIGIPTILTFLAGVEFTKVIGDNTQKTQTYIDKLHALQGAGGAAGGAVGDTGIQFAAFGTIIDAVKKSLQLMNEEIDKSGIGIVTVTGLQKTAADAADQHRLRLLGEAEGVNTVGTAVDNLKGSLDSLPREIDISINVGLTGAGAGAASLGFRPPGVAGNVDQLPPSTADLPAANSLATQVAAAEKARRDAAAAADKAAREAQQRADELARAYKDKVAHEFDNANKVATTLFDSLHAKHVRAINDAETLAQKQHDASVQAISDSLKAQQATNAAPVTAAEQAQSAIETARQQRNLQENLRTAQQSGDPRAIRDAVEALQSFQAAQNIATLKAEEDRKDAAAKADAEAKQRKADADLAAAQRQQTIDLAKEAKADRQKRADFERALVALEAKDRGKPIGTIDADIAALQAKFGIFTDPITGAHHIGDAVAAAIKDVKIEPKIEATIYNTFAFRITRKDLEAALAGGTSPSQTVTIRTGQQRPRTQ